jgi:hypothetical protein
MAPAIGSSGGSTTARASGLANAALGVALFAYICFWGFGGFLAVIFGLSARSEIARSEGRLRGRRRATLAIALGALNIAATVALAIAAGRALERWSRTTSGSSPSVTHPTLPVAPKSRPLFPGKRRAGASRAPSSVDSGAVVTEIGRITLVDPGRSGHPLRQLLEREHARADRSNAKLLLWVTAPGCGPCAGVAAALDDARMQEALAGIRMVRLDIAQFGQELVALELPTEKIPGFVLVAPDNRALDYIHGGEWDADIPANMAPILNKFVRGTLRLRRDPWHGGPHPDETPISFFW